ncbi:MAG: C45 family peptidase [Myxococcota bacterium]
MKLETLTVSGSPRAMGQAHGEAFRARIERFVEMRLEAVRGYMAERGRPDDWPQLFEVGKESFGRFEAWDPEGYAEHCGIAEGAGIDPLRLFSTANMTDMRDAVLLAAAKGAPLTKIPDEGCSSLLVPASRTANDGPLVGQTWDLNPPDVEYVVAVHRQPDEGPQTWAITCTGCLSLIGLNEHGVSVGTTNIKTYGSRAGVGYLSILHRAIRAASAKEASALVQNAPHAGAHTYWIADATTQMEWEASPNAQVRRDTEDGPIWRTNHCLATEHQALEGEVVGESSLARFSRLKEVLEPATDVNVDTLKTLFSDRARGLQSINRYAEDDQGTATNAVFIASPTERRAWACRGPADRGTWIELSFG